MLRRSPLASLHHQVSQAGAANLDGHGEALAAALRQASCWHAAATVTVTTARYASPASESESGGATRTAESCGPWPDDAAVTGNLSVGRCWCHNNCDRAAANLNSKLHCIRTRIRVRATGKFKAMMPGSDSVPGPGRGSDAVRP